MVTIYYLTIVLSDYYTFETNEKYSNDYCDVGSMTITRKYIRTNQLKTQYLVRAPDEFVLCSSDPPLENFINAALHRLASDCRKNTSLCLPS